MIKPGKIVIKDKKVHFKPDGLKKPVNPGLDCSFSEDINYIKGVEKYIASKQLIEVSNVRIIYEWYDEIFNPDDDKVYGYCIDDKKGNTAKMIKNNQSCKAEVKDNKAKIIELIKPNKQ